MANNQATVDKMEVFALNEKLKKINEVSSETVFVTEGQPAISVTVAHDLDNALAAASDIVTARIAEII